MKSDGFSGRISNNLCDGNRRLSFALPVPRSNHNGFLGIKRRDDRIPLLKNKVFPSGFELNKNRGRDSSLQLLNILPDESFAIGMRNNFSLNSWTKGEVEKDDIDDQILDGYANVAGQFFFDNSGDLELSNSQIAGIKTFSMSLSPPKATTHKNYMRGSMIRANKNGAGVDNLATSIKTSLHSVASGQMSPSSKSAHIRTALDYEEWLKTQQVIDSWEAKQKLDAESLFSSSELSTFQSLPEVKPLHLLPSTITIKVSSSVNFLSSGLTVNDIDLDLIEKSVPSSFSLGQLKSHIRLELTAAGRLSTSVSTELKNDSGRLKLSFFHFPSNTWKVLSNKADWQRAKFYAFEAQDPIKIMYQVLEPTATREQLDDLHLSVAAKGGLLSSTRKVAVYLSVL